MINLAQEPDICSDFYENLRAHIQQHLQQKKDWCYIGVCAECFCFKKKGTEMKCTNQDSPFFKAEIHPLQQNCDFFEAYWWQR